jgi:hypothetical protein
MEDTSSENGQGSNNYVDICQERQDQWLFPQNRNLVGTIILPPPKGLSVSVIDIGSLLKIQNST